MLRLSWTHYVCASSDSPYLSCFQDSVIQWRDLATSSPNTTGCLRLPRSEGHILAWLPLRLLQQQEEEFWHSNSTWIDQKRLWLQITFLMLPLHNWMFWGTMVPYSLSRDILHHQAAWLYFVHLWSAQCTSHYICFHFFLDLFPSLHSTLPSPAHIPAALGLYTPVKCMQPKSFDTDLFTRAVLFKYQYAYKSPEDLVKTQILIH